MLLDKPRRNSLFESLVSSGRDPRDFDLSEPSLIHRATGAELSIGRPGAEQFIVGYTVGDVDLVQRYHESWDGVLAILRWWVEEIERHASLPDLWAEFAREHKLGRLVAAQDVDIAPFTDAERSEVVRQLAEIRHYAETALRLPEEPRRRWTS